MMLRKRIGLLGGTFNPVHCGHVSMVKSALEEKIDKLIVMPCWLSPHKLSQADEMTMGLREHRYEMLRETFQDNSNVEVSRFEINRREPSFTWLTLDYMRQKYSHSDLILIIGWDQFEILDTWSKFHEWSKNIEFLVFPRNNEKTNFKIPVHAKHLRYQIAKDTILSISSTEIRNLIRRGLPIEHLVPSCIEDYIMKSNLYKTAVSEKYDNPLLLINN